MYKMEYLRYLRTSQFRTRMRGYAQFKHFSTGKFLIENLFLMKNPVSKQCRPDQMPHYVASDLGLHCLPMTHLRVSRLE